MIRDSRCLAIAALGCLMGIAAISNRVEWILPLFLILVPWDKALDNAGELAIEWRQYRELTQQAPSAEPASQLTMLKIK